MNSPRLSVEVQRREGFYFPGDVLRAEVRILEEDHAAMEAVECSVLWFTVGKGEEDLAVHHFERHALSSRATDLDVKLFKIECVLPASPLSYDGAIVKICWCVRARVFLHGGHEITSDAPFRLGDVAAAVVVES